MNQHTRPIESPEEVPPTVCIQPVGSPIPIPANIQKENDRNLQPNHASCGQIAPTENLGATNDQNAKLPAK